MNWQFDLMKAEHGPAVIEIFNYYIENGFSAYPEQKVPEQFFQFMLKAVEGYPAFVIKRDRGGEIVGFCLLRAYNPFPVFKRTAESSYFIKPGYTGQGLGALILNKLEEEARKSGIKVILAGISSRNEGSIRFHQRHGFAECGRFRNVGEKKQCLFDVVWMQKELAITSWNAETDSKYIDQTK